MEAGRPLNCRADRHRVGQEACCLRRWQQTVTTVDRPGMPWQQAVRAAAEKQAVAAMHQGSCASTADSAGLGG